jgi:2-phospho-L-lactate guanylyltransferase
MSQSLFDAGLLPVKAPSGAKQRLHGHLGPDGRRALAWALLVDALDLCQATPFLSWWVMSTDGQVLDAARGRGLGVLPEPPGGLNRALASATATLTGMGAGSVTVVPCDVPLATTEDLQDLVEVGSLSEVVVVPARRDGGTNGLHLRPPEVLEPCFGESSSAAHVALAERLSLRCSLLELPRLALDIDTVADVRELLESPGRERSSAAALLAQLLPARSA